MYKPSINKIEILKIFDRLIRFYLDWRLPYKRHHILPKEINTIAVIKLSAMGDAICIMPTIRQIKKWYPNCHLIWCTTNRSNPKLFENLSFIDEFFELPISRGLFKSLRLWRKKNIDVCIDADQYYQISQLLALNSQFATGFKTPSKRDRLDSNLNYEQNENEKRMFYRLACQTFDKNYSPKLDTKLPEIIKNFSLDKTFENDIALLSKSSQPIVVIYPGSSQNASFRRWDLNNYFSVAIQLLKNKVTILFAGGPDEMELMPEIDHFCHEKANCFSRINQWSLQQWFYFFQSETAFFIGNDSGLLHIAEAAGVKSVGIFGPGIAHKWSSINSKSITMVIPQKSLPCSPCIISAEGKIPQKCIRGDVACLKYINPNQVYKNAIKLIAS